MKTTESTTESTTWQPRIQTPRFQRGMLSAIVACGLLVAAITWPIQAQPAKPAQPAKAVAEVVADAVAKQANPEKPASVDAKLEKEVADLESQLKELKKGTAKYDLKALELKKKQAELKQKQEAAKHKDAAAARAAAEKAEAEERAKRIQNGASLETNSDVDMLLERARVYVEEKNYSAASTLWQHILDGPTALTDRRPSALAVKLHKDEQRGNFIYRPVRNLIETELAALPEEGMRDYRIKADVNARGMLGTIGPANEEAVLHRLVQRYFMSAVGDDAAYRLACIKLDKYDFLGARELFRKVLKQHPDPSIPRIDLLVRSSIASARAGDPAGAREALEELEASQNAVPQTLLGMVRQEVERGASRIIAPQVANGWPMDFGNFARNGIMPAMPGTPVTGARLWAELPLYDAQFNFKIDKVVNTPTYNYGQPKGPTNRASIVTRWEKGNWMPTSQVVLHGDRAFIKTHKALRAIDLASGKRVWNDVEQQGIGIPKGARIYPRMYYSSSTQATSPSTSEEMALFADRSAKAMALIDGTVFHVEGRFWLGGRAAQWMMLHNGQQKTLTFSDVLCAVDADTGAVRWRFNREGSKTRDPDLRILAAPVRSGANLILPVAKNSAEVHLLGIDFETGERVFDTFLCKGIQSTARRNALAGVALHGGEAYVATGEGVIFAVDAVMGQVKWATKYEQSKSNKPVNTRFGSSYRNQTDLPGWDDDVIIPFGNKLLVMPSDAEKLLCYSRITGKFLYSSPKDEMRYCLGVKGDRLYVAGNTLVRCYEIRTGKLAEQTPDAIGNCYARGALTANGIYMPTKEAIVRLDTQTLKELGRMPIAAKSKDPIGNLFTDGNRLVASGLDRTYALVDGEQKITELTKRIETKDSGDARFERAFLQQVVGKHAEAVADLRVAIKLLPDGVKKTEASRQLLVAILSSAEALAKSPEKAHALFDEAENVARPQGDLARVWLARGHFYDRRSEFDQALDMYLKAAADTGASLVMVKDSQGRLREARASHAGATAIRDMLRKRGEVVRNVLLERGNKAMKPYRAIAALERKMEADPSATLPQIGEVQELSQKLAAINEKAEAKKKQVAQWAQRQEQFKSAIALEKANATGALPKLEAELVEVNQTLAKAEAEAKAVERDATITRQQIELTRRDLTDTLKRLNDLQNDRVEHAAKLLRIAAMFPEVDIAMEANLAAADQLFRGEHFERGELVLRNLAGATDRRHAASAIAAMAQAYNKVGWKRQAKLEWDRVVKSFADETIRWRGDDKNALYVAKDKLAVLSGQTTEAFRRMPDAPFKRLWSDPVSGRYYLIETNSRQKSQFLEDHVLLLNTSRNKLVCREVATGEDVWQHVMNKTNVSGSSSSNGRLIKYNDYVFPGGRLLTDGHVGVLWSPKTVSAIGLATGKQLWDIKPFNANTNTNNWYYPYDDPIGPVDVGNGLLVEQGLSAKRGVEQVRATDLATGAVRWVSDFDGEGVMGVKAAGGYVNVFLNGNRNGSYFSEIVVCDLESGQQVGRVKLGNRSRYYPFTWTRFGLLSLETSKATLYELPSGKKKWETALAGKVNTSSTYMRARMIDDENCFLLARGLHIINMRGGKLKVSAGDETMGKYLQDGAVTPDGKHILVYGYTYDAKTKINTRRMSIVETATGKKVMATDIGPYTSSTRDADKVVSAGNLVPVVMREAPTMQGNVRRYSNNYDLAFYRKSDGKRMDIKLPKVGSRFSGQMWPIVRGNVFILMSYNGISAYVTDTSVKNYQAKEYVEPVKPKAPDKPGATKPANKDAPKGAAKPVPKLRGVQALPGIQIRRAIEVVPAKPVAPKNAAPKKPAQKDAGQGTKSGAKKSTEPAAPKEIKPDSKK